MNQKKSDKQSNIAEQAEGGFRFWWLLPIIAVVAAFLYLLWPKTDTKIVVPTAETPKPAAAAGATNAAAPASTADAQPLVGRWARTDGDYMLEIKKVGADGTAEVGYYNPNPINVAKATVTRETGGTKLFVELRDANYPGCTYTLVYNKADDQLKGVYFQAAMQQQYEVFFMRLEPEKK